MKMTIPLMYQDCEVRMIDGVPTPISEEATLDAVSFYGNETQGLGAIKLTLPKGRQTVILPSWLFSMKVINTIQPPAPSSEKKG